MPRFNDAGHVTPQIGYFWYDQSRFIFQDCSSGVCRVALSDGTTIAETGVVRLLGNGHRVWAYVEYTPGIDPTLAVYRDSIGNVLTNAYPQAISPDGHIAIKPHSNSGTTVLDPYGPDWSLPDDALDIQLLSGRRAIWTEGGIVHGNVPIVGNPGVPVWWPRVADDGTLLYQHQGSGALILGGKVIGPPSPRYFYPDVLLQGDVYHVTWSPNQADTDAQFLRLTRAALAALPPVGEPTKEPEEPVSLPDPFAIKAALQRERDKLPDRITNDQCGAILNAAALQFAHVGLHAKSGGEVATLPNGVTVNRNVLRYLPPGDEFGWWDDVLGAAGVGIASPVAPEWKRSTDGRSSFVPPVGVTQPDEPDDDEPEPGLTLEQRVEAIEAWIRREL
jgi:hypothetical protein